MKPQDLPEDVNPLLKTNQTNNTAQQQAQSKSNCELFFWEAEWGPLLKFSGSVVKNFLTCLDESIELHLV